MGENRRDNMGRYQSGHPGGPGRPKNGVRAALARIVDFDEMAAFVWGVLTNPRASMADRRWAAEFVSDRLEGRPTQGIAMSVRATPAELPEGWDNMNREQREAALDRLLAEGKP